MDLKTEIVGILKPIFGDSVLKIVEDNYASDNPGELIELAHHMLLGYMGEKNANKALDAIFLKFPKLKGG